MLLSAIRDTWAIFKEYTNEAMVFAMAFVLLYVVFLITDCLVRIIRHRKLHSIGYVLMKTCLFALFGIYMSYILAITLSGREIMDSSVVHNVDPFSTLIVNGSLNPEIFQNFVMMVPLGILIPSAFKYLRGLVRTTLFGLILSVSIEVAQIVLRRGYFDVDDIIFNTCGACAGYLIFAGFYDGMLGIKRRIITDASKELKIKPPLGNLYNRFALKHGAWLFVVQAFPVFVWGNFIMGFSSDNGDKSGGMSKALLAKIMSVLSMGQIKVTGAQYDDEGFLMLEKVLRKCAHVFEYAVLAVLIWALLFSIRWIAGILTYGLALLGAFAVGMIDETNQMSVIGRTGTYKDVVVDMSGSVVVLIITLVIVKSATNYYIKKHSK